MTHEENSRISPTQPHDEHLSLEELVERCWAPEAHDFVLQLLQGRTQFLWEKHNLGGEPATGRMDFVFYGGEEPDMICHKLKSLFGPTDAKLGLYLNPDVLGLEVYVQSPEQYELYVTLADTATAGTELACRVEAATDRTRVPA